MIRPLVNWLFDQPEQSSSRSGGRRQSRRRRQQSVPAASASIPVENSSRMMSLPEQTLQSLAEVADDFAASTISPQPTSDAQSNLMAEERAFAHWVKRDTAGNVSNTAVKALNQQLQTSSMNNTVAVPTRPSFQTMKELAGSARGTSSVQTRPGKTLLPRPVFKTTPSTRQNSVVSLAEVRASHQASAARATSERAKFLCKVGEVKLLFKIKKGNYHGYITPDDGSCDIIFHQKYVGVDVVTKLERGMQVEVMTRQIAGKAYAEQLRIL